MVGEPWFRLSLVRPDYTRVFYLSRVENESSLTRFLRLDSIVRRPVHSRVAVPS